jgi:hypothetical protein
MALRGLSRRLVLAVSIGIAGGPSALAGQPFSPTSHNERAARPTASPARPAKRPLERTAAFPSSSGDHADVSATRIGKAGRTEAIDVVLDNGNTLRGRFVDVDGMPIDGAVVTLSRGTDTAARTTTDADGLFEIRRVPNGTYRLACGSAAGRVRCWSTEAAPPNALAGGVTFQDGVIRGQAALLIPAIGTSALVTGAATAGAVVGGVAMSSGSHGNRSALSSGPPTDGDGEPTAFNEGGRANSIVVSSDPFDSQVEYRVVDGRLVRVVHPEAEGGVDRFDNDFGDPRDQNRQPPIPNGEADTSHAGFDISESLPDLPEDFTDELPASP